MDYNVRTGQRADLTATLRQLEADRGERGQSERAADAAHAAEQLESGGDAAYFDRVVYAPGEKDRYTVRRGTKAWVMKELRDSALTFYHDGDEAKAGHAKAAWTEVAQGAESVRVGHLVYEISG